MKITKSMLIAGLGMLTIGTASQLWAATDYSSYSQNNSHIRKWTRQKIRAQPLKYQHKESSKN